MGYLVRSLPLHRYVSEWEVLCYFYLFHQLSCALVCVPRVTLVLLFQLAAVFPPIGRRFSVRFLVLILRAWQFWEFAFVLALPTSFFLSIVSVAIYLFLVAYNRLEGLFFLLALPGWYIPVPLVSLSPRLPFSTRGPHSGEWLVESYYRSRVWFIYQPQTLTKTHFCEWKWMEMPQWRK